MALQAAAENRAGLLVPLANASEAAVVEGLNDYPVGSLAEAVGFLSGRSTWTPIRSISKRSFAISRTTKAPLSTSRGRTKPSGLC